METNTIINKLSLKEKLLNLFIVGFKNNSEFKNLESLIVQGLGGIIFFADNFKTRKEFVNLVNNLQETGKNRLFISVDQEGGLVERTIKLDKKIKYLTPLSSSKLSKQDFKTHYNILSKDLSSMGFNLNFAPCCDVNTQELNPIIGIRSFSNKVEKVKELSKNTSEILSQNQIIPVLKHFPGHGASNVDSHIDMPTIDLSLEDLEKNHIEAFKQKADMIMIAHAYYPCFDKEKTPASLSKNVINYLQKELNYNGVIITDDMVMGGIANYYKPVDACINALQTGVDMFIFRNTNSDFMKMLNELESIIKTDNNLQKQVNRAFLKVLNLKEKYNLITKKSIDIKNAQKTINKLAFNTIKTKGNINLQKGKTLIISPNKNQIYNLSFDNTNLSDFIDSDEIFYDNVFGDEFISYIKEKQNTYKNIIFIGYNTLLSEYQQKLINELKEYIAISIGINENIKYFKKAKGIIIANGYNEPIIRALKLSLKPFKQI